MLLNASTAWSSDFDVDNDGVVAPLTDGLLVLRHFFGFTGTALTEGALGADATNTTAEMIQAHINDRPDRFDLDGDGLHQPLTDGPLLLRLLFGFTGEALPKARSATKRIAEPVIAFLGTLKVSSTLVLKDLKNTLTRPVQVTLRKTIPTPTTP